MREFAMDNNLTAYKYFTLQNTLNYTPKKRLKLARSMHDLKNNLTSKKKPFYDQSILIAVILQWVGTCNQKVTRSTVRQRVKPVNWPSAVLTLPGTAIFLNVPKTKEKTPVVLLTANIYSAMYLLSICMYVCYICM